MKKLTLKSNIAAAWNRNTRLVSILVLSVFTLTAFTACEDDDDDPIVDTINQQDKNFAISASQTINGQIALATLAKTKGDDDSVIEYANMIFDDHTAAKAELTGLASSREFEISNEVSAGMQAQLTALTLLSGNDFDKAFINSQIEINDNIRSMMKNQVDNGLNTLLRTFADKLSEKVDGHQKEALLVKAEIAIENI
jgi:predicted outer membrane protein